jgi:hypothetical protein
MSIGANNGGETPPAPDKNQGQTGKMSCKSEEQAENHKNNPRRSWVTNQMGNPSLTVLFQLFWIAFSLAGDLKSGQIRFAIYHENQTPLYFHYDKLAGRHSSYDGVTGVGNCADE